MGEADHGQLVPAEHNHDLVKQDDEIERIRASIEITRSRISDALDDVQDGVNEKLAWREWVREHPRASVGIALGIGYLLGRV